MPLQQQVCVTVSLFARVFEFPMSVSTLYGLGLAITPLCHLCVRALWYSVHARARVCAPFVELVSCTLFARVSNFPCVDVHSGWIKVRCYAASLCVTCVRAPWLVHARVRSSPPFALLVDCALLLCVASGAIAPLSSVIAHYPANT